MTQRQDLFGTEIIDRFRNEYDFLSNFYLGAPIEIWGHTFPTTEHAYQWAKTNDPAEKDWVLWDITETSNGGVLRVVTTPGVAKRRGAQVTRRPDWEEARIQIMLDINRAKYTQHSDLRQKLIATEDAILIEGNTWHDNFWGSCTCEECGDKGENMLGKVLMQLREELKVCPGKCWSK